MSSQEPPPAAGYFAIISSLLSDPRLRVAYVFEALFLFKAMASKRELPQRNVYEVLPTIELSSITLGALDTNDAWFWGTPSYTADFVNLCLLFQILQPRVVLEIGTLRG